MKNRYPLKYVILTFNNLGNYKVGFNPSTDAYGYIPALAYLVSEKTSYYDFGKESKSYEVVLPFNGIKDKEMRHPIFNEKGECTNSVKVNEVYDSIYDAREVCSRLNDMIKDRISNNIGENNSIKLNDFEIRLSELEEIDSELFHKSRDIIKKMRISK